MDTTLEQKFNESRQRILAGEQLSLKEMAELVALLRQSRFSAAEPGEKKSKAKAKSTPISDEDLDKQLGDLGL